MHAFSWLDDRGSERWAFVVLMVWALWLSVEHLAFGGRSYVWVHDLADSYVPLYFGEKGAGFSALFGGWDYRALAGVDWASHNAGQFKLLKFVLHVMPGWLAFGLFGVLQRCLAGYFMYRTIIDVFGGRRGPALAAGTLAAVGLQPGGAEMLAGFNFNQGLGLSALPLLVWLHWRLADTRPWLLITVLFVAGALISLMTLQVFAWPVLVCFGIWVLVFTPVARLPCAILALAAFGIGYGLFEIPNVIAMLADLPDSHRAFMATNPPGEKMRDALAILKRLAVLLAAPIAAIGWAIHRGGRKAVPGRLFLVFAGCVAILSFDSIIGWALPQFGFLVSFQFVRIFFVLPFLLILTAGVGLATVLVADDGPATSAGSRASVLHIMVAAMVLWAVGQSLWVKFQELRYYAHGSNYALLLGNPVMKNIAGLKNDENPFRVETVVIKGVTHLARPAYPWALGLETASGYVNIYPRRYQELWVRMIAPSAKTSSYDYAYMADWGNRLFLTAKATDCRSVRLGEFANLNLLSLLNVRFVASPCPLQDSEFRLFAETRDGPGQAWHRLGKFEKLKAALRGDFPSKELYVYENTAVMPRYFLAGQVEVFAGREATLAALGRAGREKLLAVAFVTVGDAKGLTLPSNAAQGAGLAGTVRVLHVGQNEIRLEAVADREAVLIVANSYSPRWTATVNGEAKHVFPVDHALQGVVVGNGRSEVTLTYTSAVRRMLDRLFKTVLGRRRLRNDGSAAQAGCRRAA